MAIGEFFTGSRAKSQQFPTVTPQQANVKGAAGRQALQMLQGLGGGQFGQSPIAQQARTQFQTQTIPGLAERFTSLGGGAQRSSAFQGAIGQAGSELEQGLAALEQQNALQLLPYLLQASLQPEAETGITPEQPGFLQSAGGSLLQILPILLGAYLGGPGGAAAGGTAGSGLSNFFNSFFQKKQQSQPTALNNPILPDFSSLINNVLSARS